MAEAFSRPRLCLCIAKHVDERCNSAQNHCENKCEIPGHRQTDPGISQLPLQVTAAWVTPDPVTLSGGMPDHAGVRTGLRGQC